ncbi:efflux RND transporter periplasmic adaptor subunit [Patescibacteria group bacterium]|nr:efflux RND transporter periplasmic adaptor subunit [Patescibacteria group bacterium]
MHINSRQFTLLALIAATAIIAAAFWAFSGALLPSSAVHTVTVTRGDLTEVVTATGPVTPVQSVDLAFQIGGSIRTVDANVGMQVAAGQQVATLDSTDLQAQLDKAKADLATQQAILHTDQVTLANHYTSVITALNDAFAKTNDAVRNQIDNLFINGETDTPKLTFMTFDLSAQTAAEGGRLHAQSELDTWRSELDALSASQPETALYAALQNGQEHMQTIRGFLSSVSDALNKYYGISQSQADTAKGYLATATSEVNAAITETIAEQQAIDAQQAAIAAQQANISSYDANVQTITAQLSKTVLASPISGVVSVQNAKVGQIAAPNAVIATIISSAQFQIEAYVPETDIAKVAVGDAASTTLDAYGNGAVFPGRIVKVDPAATIVQGVSQYKITMLFTAFDPRIKAGMNGNIAITTAHRSQVLVIPQDSVILKNGAPTVLVDAGQGTMEERAVQLGVSGSNGMVEVISGLTEGEQIAGFGNPQYERM